MAAVSQDDSWARPQVGTGGEIKGAAEKLKVPWIPSLVQQCKPELPLDGGQGPQPSLGTGTPPWPRGDTPAFPYHPTQQHQPLPSQVQRLGNFVPGLPFPFQTAPSSGGSYLRAYKLERTEHGTPAR